MHYIRGYRVLQVETKRKQGGIGIFLFEVQGQTKPGALAVIVV